MATVEEYRAEFAGALSGMAEAQEGLADMTKHGLGKAAAPVQAQLAVYERRRQLLLSASRALATFEQAYQRLTADGYPALAPVVIPDDALEELFSEQRQWAKALATFTKAAPPAEADTVEMTAAGEAENKP